MKYGGAILNLRLLTNIQSEPFIQNTALYSHYYSADTQYILYVILTACQSWHLYIRLKQILFLNCLRMKSLFPKQYCMHCIYIAAIMWNPLTSVCLMFWLQFEAQIPAQTLTRCYTPASSASSRLVISESAFQL